MIMKNSVNWVEIPVKDIDRAKKFYGIIFNAEIADLPHPYYKYAALPSDVANGGVGGALVEGEGYEPSDKGSLIYLNGGDDLSVCLSKVEKAGGKIILPKTSLGANGFIAQFEDTEGNKVAFHSWN